MFPCVKHKWRVSSFHMKDLIWSLHFSDGHSSLNTHQGQKQSRQQAVSNPTRSTPALVSSTVLLLKSVQTDQVYGFCSVLFLRYVLRLPTQVHRRIFILQRVSFIAILSTAAHTRCRSRRRFCMRQSAALGAAIKYTVSRGIERR